MTMKLNDVRAASIKVCEYKSVQREITEAREDSHHLMDNGDMDMWQAIKPAVLRVLTERENRLRQALEDMGVQVD